MHFISAKHYIFMENVHTIFFLLLIWFTAVSEWQFLGSLIL